MNPTAVARRLASNAVVFRHLLAPVGEHQARWKPAPGKWSLLEVICHLADEERDDFRHRLDLTLHHPGESWPPIDPEGWARDRAYNARDPQESLEDFLRERKRSVKWLEGLDSFDPDAHSMHPRLGRITGGMLLHSWLAHDLLHIQQTTRLHYAYLRHTLGAEALAYAGTPIFEE